MMIARFIIWIARMLLNNEAENKKEFSATIGQSVERFAEKTFEARDVIFINYKYVYY